MKKITSFLLLLSSIPSFAQIPNAGLDAWTPSGKPAPFDWEAPTSWTTSNGATEFISAGVKKSTDKYSSVYAAELKTLNVFGSNVPGIMVNGVAKMDMSNYTVDVMSAGSPISSRPLTFEGWWKFTATTTGDSAYAAVIMKKWNSSTNKSDTVGWAAKALGPSSTYANFSMTITYINGSVQPDSVVCVILSSKPNDIKAAGVLLVDALGLSGISGISDILGSNAFHAWPNPFSDRLEISLTGIHNEMIPLEIFNSAGLKVHTAELNVRNGKAEVLLGQLPPGFYCYRLLAGGQYGYGKLIKTSK